MKRTVISLLAGACVLLGFGSSAAYAEPQGETVRVKGEVVDLWCYLEGGDHGADHKDCAIACAKAGNPIGLLTEKSEIYVMMGLQDHQPGRDLLMDKMAATVTITGTLEKKGGEQVIYVASAK